MADADSTRRRGRRVLWAEKSCAWCKALFLCKPAKATKRAYCSMSCSSKHKAALRGHDTSDPSPHYCCGCHSEFMHKSRRKNLGKFCSRECGARLATLVSQEKASLRRIGVRARAKPPKPVVNRLVCKCVACGNEFAQRTHWGRKETRCQSCKQQYAQRLKSEYRKSPAYRAIKARRKAIERGRSGYADRIDPIRVFERDHWQCHICRTKTLRNKRGTLHPRAPELDHLVTLADGGTHTWGNVACACRRCNGAKGGRSLGQLGLAFAA